MIDNPFVCDLPLSDQIDNVRDALDAARQELLAYNITEDRAFRALEAPEYRRYTDAGRAWRDAHPWLHAAWTVRQAQIQLREMYAEQRARQQEARMAEQDAILTAEAEAGKWAADSELKQVIWSNVWNWTHSGGIASRVHLTKDDGLTGKTLCGKEFPRVKGCPSGYAACKTCWKKAGRLTQEQWHALPRVPSAVD